MIIHDSFTNVVSTTHSLCIKFKTSVTKSRPQKQTLSLYVKNKITEVFRQKSILKKGKPDVKLKNL